MLLRTFGLRKSFGNYNVLNGLNLAVREGNIYGFLGRNGAGKTTTIQILMGIQQPGGGSIEYFGKRLRRPGIGEKRSIGYVSQEQFFYPWMSCRYLGVFTSRFYPDWDESWFEHLLRVFDLPPKRKVVDLSQGMKVKLALALALAHRPKILILDEPTSGLDPAARREFLELVLRQAQDEGRTTFFSSHIVEEVERIANRVGILEEGTLCYEGDTELLRREVRRIDWDPNGRMSAGEFDEMRVHLESEGFEVLSHRHDKGYFVARGHAGNWARWTNRAEVSMLNLEDIFLALTVDRVYKS